MVGEGASEETSDHCEAGLEVAVVAVVVVVAAVVVVADDVEIQ